MPASYPPHNAWIISFAGLCCLFAGLRSAPMARGAFWLGLVYGALSLGLTVSWLFRIFPAQVPFALFVLFGLFHAAFAGIFFRCAPRLRFPSLFAAALWTSIEFYRSEWFALHYPWITPGIALGPTFLSPLVGVYGATFLVVLAAAMATQHGTRVAGAALAAILLAMTMLRPAVVEPHLPLRVAAIQAEEAMISTYCDMTLSATNAPQLVVWPEESYASDIRKDAPRDFQKLVALASNLSCVLTFGTQTRTGAGPRDWWNTALTIDRSGALGEHYKNRPVPLFNDGRPSDRAAPVTTPAGVAATPICYDCDSPEITRRMTAAGAQFFAVPSMDAERWSAKQHIQHAALVRLRAAECGRWFVVGSSSGISQIVDPNGCVRGILPVMSPGVLCGTIGIENRITPYVRFGWLLPRVLIIASLAGIVIASFKKLEKL